MMNDDYSWVTDEAYDAELVALLDETPAASILQIPGVYEAVAEHFNDDALTRLEAKRDEEKDTQ